MRTTPAGVVTDFQGENPHPVVLVEVQTGGTPLRWTNWDTDLTFAGVTFSKREVSYRPIRIAGVSQGPGTSRLEVAETDLVVTALIEAGTIFQGRRVKVFRTRLASTGGGGSDSEYDVFTVDAVDLAPGRVAVFHLKPLQSVFDVEVPLGTLDPAEFPGIPLEP